MQTDMSAPAAPADLLARDFNSIRALITNWLDVHAPAWQERHLADIGIVLIDAMAYLADHISYRQDAVGTEAYLETARLPKSVRRHTRLLDYRPGDAVGARVLAMLTPARDGLVLPEGTLLSTAQPIWPVLVPEAVLAASGCEVFATCHPVSLWRDHAAMPLEGALAAGATTARLARSYPHLQPGALLVLVGPGGRHPVRLMAAAPHGGGTQIHWHDDDALPPQLAGDPLLTCHGNQVLADHGRPMRALLPMMASGLTLTRLAVDAGHLAHLPPYCHARAQAESAAALLKDASHPLPALQLRERLPGVPAPLQPPRPHWQAGAELVAARADDRLFVVEPDGAGRISLRFGDGRQGAQPDPAWQLEAHWRQGGGSAGNIGIGTLRHAIDLARGVLAVDNLLPGWGGRDPETITTTRQLAAMPPDNDFRCVTTEDYVAALVGVPGVVSTTAHRHWQAGRSEVRLKLVVADGHHPERMVARVHRQLAPRRLIGDHLQVDLA